MSPTSTDTSRAARRRRRRRIRGAMLAASVAISIAGFAATRGGPTSVSPTALASSVEVGRELPERASRGATAARADEPVPPPAVTVTAGGAGAPRRDVYVRAATVGDLLAGLGIAVDGDDEVTPAVDAPPGRAVTVVRVDVTRTAEERVIPVRKELRDDPALERGATRVEADGAPGRERVVWEIIRRDGKVAAKRQVSTETLTAASPRVVIVGRGDGRGAPTDGGVPLKPRIAASGTPSSSRNSGSQEGGASWYRYKAGTCAHRTLPKGTVVKVTNSKSGKTARCTVADRGPFIAGRIIDLDHSVFMAVADSPGQGVLRVRIEW